MDLGNATEPYRALFANGSVPPSMLGEDHDFAEFEIARDARRVLETQMPGNVAASADEADVVLVALWPYGLCMLNVSGQTVGMEDWQTEKGILASDESTGTSRARGIRPSAAPSVSGALNAWCSVSVATKLNAWHGLDSVSGVSTA